MQKTKAIILFLFIWLVCFNGTLYVPVTFLDLDDTPTSYSGSTLYCVRVNAAGTALEFVACGSSHNHDTTYVARTDWTTHDSYPTACSNQAVTGIGDTLTCNSIGPTYLAAVDFGSFTCNGTSCTIDDAAITPAMVGGSPTNGYCLTYASGVLSSGSVTQDNMRLSIVNGTAFVDFSAANVLTNNLGYTLTIYDSTNKTLVGYIKVAGTGETYGSELAPNPSLENTTNVLATNATVTVDAGGYSGNCIKVTGTAPDGRGTESVSTANGRLYKYTGYCKKGTDSYTGSEIGQWDGSQYTTLKGFWSDSSSWTGFAIYGTTRPGTQGTSIRVYAGNGVYNYWDEVSFKQILTPSATGVTIVSSYGGSTYNWTSETTGFNRNDPAGYTYEISSTGSWVWQPCTDHGALTGLGDDDHTQYVLRQPTADTVINDAGSDYDFRIESDNNANMFYMDAGNDRIGVKTSTPQKEVDIRGDLFIPGIDTAVDCNGSSTSGVGSCDSISDGATLVSISSTAPYNLDFNNNAAADGYPLCTNSFASPTIICLDNYEGDWDTSIDCDGTATSTKGTCTTYANNTTLVSMSSNNLDINNDAVADGQPLCTNSLTTPTIVCVDVNANCADGAGGATLLGTPCSSATITVTSAWGFKDDDADSLLDNGEDLYIDNTNNSGVNKLRMTHDCTLGCDANDTTLLGTPGATAINIVTSAWGFKDDDADSLLDNGEDLYIDYSPSTQYYSTGSQKVIVDTQSTNAVVEIKGTLIIR